MLSDRDEQLIQLLETLDEAASALPPRLQRAAELLLRVDQNRRIDKRELRELRRDMITWADALARMATGARTVIADTRELAKQGTPPEA